MLMLRIALVRTLRRLCVKLQRGVIQCFEANLAGVETGYGILAHHAEEASTRFLARTRLVFEAERLEQGSLLLCRKVRELLPRDLFRVRVQPREPGAKAILRIGIARHHEIDKLRDTRFLRARCAIAGDNDVRQPLDHCILAGREKLRTVHSRLNLQRGIADMPTSKSPFAEAWKLGRGRGCSQNAQDLPSSDSLSGHSFSLS